MTGAFVLVLVAFALMRLGHSWMLRADWPQRAPRLAIAVWQALAASVIISFILACFALAIPGLSAASTVGEVLRLCLIELSDQYSTISGAVMSTLVFAAGAAFVGRISLELARQWRRTVRIRTEHLDRLAMVSQRLDDGVLLVDHPSAIVYCVPGSRLSMPGVVVMTRTVRELLTDKQVEMVLRHENAHLRSGHARLIERSRALANALPWLPFFGVAHEQISKLAEMHADDAVAPADRLSLAAALYRLSAANHGTPPPGTLSAANVAAVLRARRLVHPHRPLGRSRSAGIVASIIGMTVLPMALAFLPADVGVSHDCCTYNLGQTTTQTAPQLR